MRNYEKKPEQNQDKKQDQENWTVPEIEGHGWMYFYVCGECHGQVNWHDPVCSHCGWRLNWNG